uniref:Uncharacterized protein n=1 Tax=Sphingobacterium sp. (strain 21) TaxID=743722 RepID=F4CFM9_SPHS2
MNFFNLYKKNKSSTTNTNTANEVDADTPLVQRLQTFLSKLYQRAEEMHSEIQVSGQRIADADKDPFKRSFLQFKAGTIAQFTAIIQKGSNTYQEEVIPKASTMELVKISQIFNDWHIGVLNMMTSAFDQISERDLEKEYADIMKIYTHYKDHFHCKQCGGKLEISTFYFTATYIACPYCRTQNTFDPGTQVRLVEHLARPLAELRCNELYERYQEHRRAFGTDSAKEKYQLYLQALIDEMNRILPGLNAQHQNFYDRLLSDYERFEQFR